MDSTSPATMIVRYRKNITRTSASELAIVGAARRARRAASGCDLPTGGPVLEEGHVRAGQIGVAGGDPHLGCGGARALRYVELEYGHRAWALLPALDGLDGLLAELGTGSAAVACRERGVEAVRDRDQVGLLVSGAAADRERARGEGDACRPWEDAHGWLLPDETVLSNRLDSGIFNQAVYQPSG
jgi:hypothetical protein